MRATAALSATEPASGHERKAATWHARYHYDHQHRHRLAGEWSALVHPRDSPSDGVRVRESR